MYCHSVSFLTNILRKESRNSKQVQDKNEASRTELAPLDGHNRLVQGYWSELLLVGEFISRNKPQAARARHSILTRP